MKTLEIDGTQIRVSGSIIRIAEIKDEEWLEDEGLNPEQLFHSLKKGRSVADIFTFFQKLPDTQPRFPFYYEWDNVAAICTAKYDDWWNNLPQEARKNVRRAAKRGVVIRSFPLNDETIRGIMEIYDESAIRQGQPFAHYRKGFDYVKREVSSLPGRSVFLGAYFQEELIGFVKLVLLGPIIAILHIVSKNSHYDKRPSTALIAACAELCRDQGVAYLVYGKYVYGNKTNSSLTEFKRRTGFEQVPVPRYYVPLTLVGRLSIRLGLHRGLIGLIPSRLLDLMLAARSIWYNKFWVPKRIANKSRSPSEVGRGVDGG